MVKVLLVEDDRALAEVVHQALTRQHYQVDLAADGREGWELAEAFEYDLMLLDVVLPQLDGLNFCRQRREQGDRTPILLLTSRDGSPDKVAGLDAGADDYLVKPFDIDELLARIRALLRRTGEAQTPAIQWGALQLDPSRCQVTYGGKFLKLTAKEYELLELFLRNPHRIFSQSALLDRLWSFDEPPSENAVRTQIKTLRKKLKRAGAKDIFETIYGLGYRLKGDEQAQGDRGKQGEVETETEPHSSSAISPAIAQVWERHRARYCDRIAVLEEAISLLASHPLSPELRDRAMREAHTLAGSLGSFGFQTASEKSRAIERLLQAESPRSHFPQLSTLVTALRQDLETEDSQALAADPTSSSSQAEDSSSLRLLVVDDDPALVQAIVQTAIAWKMTSEGAANLAQARAAIARNSPDIVVLDLGFPESTEAGFELLAELTAAQPPIPAIVFTAKDGWRERLKAVRLGAKGFLQKPISPNRVLETASQILQQSPPLVGKLLIVDDDPLLLERLSQILRPWGLETILLDNPQQFWPVLEQTEPNLLIVALEMPEVSGIELCQVVRNEPKWHDLPVLVLCGDRVSETVQQVFFAGADDYIQKPIVEPELIARILNRLERSQLRRKVVADWDRC